MNPSKTLRDIMSADPVMVQPDTSIQEVARLMQSHDIGNVLITENDRLSGIVTDRDLVVRALTGNVDPNSAVRDYMTSASDLLTCTPETSLQDAAQQMADRQVRRLPVVDSGGKPVGIVSLADLAVKSSGGADETALEGISQPSHNQ